MKIAVDTDVVGAAMGVLVSCTRTGGGSIAVFGTGAAARGARSASGRPARRSRCQL